MSISDTILLFYLIVVMLSIFGDGYLALLSSVQFPPLLATGAYLISLSLLSVKLSYYLVLSTLSMQYGMQKKNARFNSKIID
jgi:purine-cytosine permease-like protein